jgi:hypothetical protein
VTESTRCPVLPRARWQDQAAAHERRVDGWLRGELSRRSRRGRAGIEDFLLTYYSYKPGQLRRWQPGHGVALADATLAEFGPRYRLDASGNVILDTAALIRDRGDSIAWIHELLVATASRAPHLGCFGMHEWAMVYRPEEGVRHAALPLRLSADRTAAVVEELAVRCSHFDAFRFFTPAARPLNALQPTRETQTALEQPGCLHANMDVYRWAYKLAPLTPSELVADCFDLAREIRILDMQASPYDLDSLALTPIAVETPAGRAEYVRQQRYFATRATELRQRLIDVCEAVLGSPEAVPRPRPPRSRQPADLPPHPDLPRQPGSSDHREPLAVAPRSVSEE